MEPETWKPIPSLGNEYEASTLGRVRSVPKPGARGRGNPKGRIIKTPSGNNRPHFSACVGGKRVTRVVGRVVYEAFNGPIPQRHGVAHLDRDVMNARPENLYLKIGVRRARLAINPQTRSL